MKKSKKNKTHKDPETEFKKWWIKVYRLKEEIGILEELSKSHKISSSSLSVAVFLLKMQIIEFELRQLITEFDQEVRSDLNKNASIINRKVRLPKEFDGKMLGKIISIFCEFEGVAVPENLKTDLKNLGALRNKFVHDLFSPKMSYDDLKIEADKGIDLTDKILDYIEKAKYLLNKKT